VKPVAHESAAGHVTGEALYTDDLIGRFANVLHAYPVCSPYAHARLIGLDAAPALAVAGVVTVLTAEDVIGQNDCGSVRHDEPVFPSVVMFHQQPVAWVLGDTLEAARAGAAAVQAKYEPLPAIVTIEDAIAKESYLLGPALLSEGDTSNIERSPLVFSGEVAIGGQEHFYLETQCALAFLDEGGGVTVHSSTQHPSETQDVVARVLGVPRNRVTVECLRMGGAFGGKEVQANGWAAVAALGAHKTKRPVRVRLSRAQDMALTGKRHPFLARFTAGFERDGRIRAAKIALYSDGGWCLDLSGPVLWRAMFHCDNAYHLPAVEITGYVCRTHKTSQTALRGFGGPQGMLVIEEIMDRAARLLALPPETVRERNFYRDGHCTHYGEKVKDANRILTIWNRLKDTSDFTARRVSTERFNEQHPHRKRGIAITPVKFGISFTATLFNQAGALVLIYRDGSVQVNHGGTEMGQGLHTKIRQIAASALGVPLDRVRVMSPRTDKVPNTSATAASAGTDLNGAAVLDACTQLRARLADVASQMLGDDASEIVFAGGRAFTSANAGAAIPFAKLCDAAYARRVPLFAQGYYRTPDIHYDPATGRGTPFYYYAYGAAVSEVEIDAYTGLYRLLRVDILEDVGDSIAPLIDRGQVEGGFIQGAGWLTLEEFLWDAEGRVATGGASTYKLPSWTELPGIFNVDFLERAAEPGVVFGSKAVGEPPLMLAISVREALRDAVAAFGSGGIVLLPCPSTPEKVFFAIREAKKTAPVEIEAR
jgi:xanthine dehydrogenase large subunit